MAEAGAHHSALPSEAPDAGDGGPGPGGQGPGVGAQWGGGQGPGGRGHASQGLERAVACKVARLREKGKS